jgi:pimeloyl-ACP methyl ester carboxylesterase
MFETLIPLLAENYHLVAPDYPSFGLSDSPPPSQYAYAFDHIATTVDHFTEALKLSRYSLYLQDYGGPVRFRLALAHPDRINAIVIQNAVASEDGLGPAWDLRKAFWKDRAAYEQKIIPNFLSFAATKGRHLGSSPNIISDLVVQRRFTRSRKGHVCEGASNLEFRHVPGRPMRSTA